MSLLDVLASHILELCPDEAARGHDTQGGTSNGMLQHYVQAGQFDRACKEVEQGGAAFEDFDTALGLALLPAGLLLSPDSTPERDAARGLFVASVLASQSRPLSEAPDGGYVRGALPPAAKNLHVSAVRAVLTSQWFRASTVLYRRNQITEAIESYLETSFDIDDLVRQHPQRMLLEGQPGYDQNAPWVTDLAFLRSMSDDYRENLCTFYRRATTIGEMLCGVADQKAGDDVAGIDARLELLRIATANLEENAGYVPMTKQRVRAEWCHRTPLYSRDGALYGGPVEALPDTNGFSTTSSPARPVPGERFATRPLDADNTFPWNSRIGVRPQGDTSSATRAGHDTRSRSCPARRRGSSSSGGGPARIRRDQRESGQSRKCSMAWRFGSIPTQARVHPSGRDGKNVSP